MTTQGAGDVSEQKRQEKINQALQAFKDDSVAFMNQLPPKRDSNDEVVSGGTLFSEADIESKDYIIIRDGFRGALADGQDESTRSGFQSDDLAQNVVDTFKYSQLEDMESAGLMEASLDESPWSDDYWAMYSGILGKRFADPEFPLTKDPGNKDWKKQYDYVQANPASTILAGDDEVAINRLSPSEKYDALIGDDSGNLTRIMWEEGKGYYDQSGKVETWMGICHGWAPAAYMLDRPQKSIVLKAADGRDITFYPSDIKSLATLLWANRMPTTRFIGGRCNEKEPKQDESGRIISQEAFDTNPGTWHQSVVNQIGVAKRSLVLDVTFDYEVWNQPIHAYTYRYFNPQSYTYADSLEAAKVSKAEFTADRFKQYRSSRAVDFVGVHMELSYVVETDPNQNETDTPDQDLIRKVDYYYDLEIKSNNWIVGGEWYTNKHPDFLWTPAPDARAVTSYDRLVSGDWESAGVLPSSWQVAAKQAAVTERSPLAVIVEKMIKRSRA